MDNVCSNTVVWIMNNKLMCAAAPGVGCSCGGVVRTINIFIGCHNPHNVMLDHA